MHEDILFQRGECVTHRKIQDFGEFGRYDVL